MIEGEILHSEGARETQEEQEILPEDFSEFFGDLKLAKGRLEFLEKEVNEFLTDEEISQEKLERLLGGIDGMEKEAEKLEEFFSKESFEQRVFKEYFYEDIKRDFRESTLRYSVEAIRGYQLDPLKRELGQGLEKLKGLEERAQKGKERMDDNRRETEESKEKILARASEIEKDLSGLIGKFRRKNYDSDILERINSLRDALDSGKGDLPGFSDSSLRSLIEEEQRFLEYQPKTQGEVDWCEKRENEILEEIQTKTANRLEEIKMKVEEVSGAVEILDEKSRIEVEWQIFFKNTIVPEFNLTDEDRDFYDGKMARKGKEVTYLDRKSFENIKESLAYFLRYLHRNRGWDKEKTLGLLRQELERVGQTKFINIGKGETGLTGLLTEGSLKCIWEFPEEEQRKKSRGGLMDRTGKEYLYRRRQTEKDLGVSRKNPISASLGSRNTRDEYGAPVQYGDYMIVLNEDVFDRCIFVEGDSMNSNWMIEPFEAKGYEKKTVKDRRLVPEHAVIAKALFNLYRYRPESDNYSFPKRIKGGSNHETMLEYIEALVLGGVKLEDVKEVVVGSVDKVPEDIKKLLQEKGVSLLEKASFGGEQEKGDE